MALSYKAQDILYDARRDATNAVEKLNLNWDVYGDRFQNSEAVKAVVEPMLARHIEAGVRLSYSKTNELWTAVFNVAYDVCGTFIDRARHAEQEAKRKEVAKMHKVVKSIRLEQHERVVSAFITYSLPNGETDSALLLEGFDPSVPNGVAIAQAELMLQVAANIKPKQGE